MSEANKLDQGKLEASYTYCFSYGVLLAFGGKITNPCMVGYGEMLFYLKQQLLTPDHDKEALLAVLKPLVLFSDELMSNYDIPYDRLVEVCKYGAKKYGDLNYSQGMDCRRFIDAAERHVLAFFKYGIHKDEESGLSHLAHHLANWMMFYDQVCLGVGINKLSNTPE
jgi:hypothetical protein